MKRTLLLTSILTVAAAGPALAQDWSGPYIGASVGYAQPKSDSERLVFDRDLDGQYDDTVTTSLGADAFSPGFCDGAPLGNNAAAGCASDDDEYEFGVRAGYDWQFGSWVVGGVVEANYANLTDSVTGFSSTPAAYTFTRETD